MTGMAAQVSEAFRLSSEELGKRVEGLTRTTDGRLQEISGQVEKRLSEGFEKTTETFVRVLEHLSRIDEAQKRITELSSNVVSLQEVLTDKRSRGAFGEVQLAGLVDDADRLARTVAQANPWLAWWCVGEGREALRARTRARGRGRRSCPERPRPR